MYLKENRIFRPIPALTDDIRSVESPQWPEIRVPKRVETLIAQLSPETLAELDRVKARLKTTNPNES